MDVKAIEHRPQFIHADFWRASMLPNRGEKYNGPDGPVEVVAVDGAFENGSVTVTPAGRPGAEPKVVPLTEWRNNYVYAGPETADFGGGTARKNDALTAAARAGYEDRIAGRPASPRPEGAKESDQVTTTLGRGEPEPEE